MGHGPGSMMQKIIAILKEESKEPRLSYRFPDGTLHIFTIVIIECVYNTNWDNIDANQKDRVYKSIKRLVQRKIIFKKPREMEIVFDAKRLINY